MTRPINRYRIAAGVLTAAHIDDVVLKTADSEYALTAVRDEKYEDAKRRLSDVVMAYLDELGERGQLPTLAIPAETDRVDCAPVFELVVELAQPDASAAGITGARKGPSGLFPNCGHVRILRAFGEEQSSPWTGW